MKSYIPLYIIGGVAAIGAVVLWKSGLANDLISGLTGATETGGINDAGSAGAIDTGYSPNYVQPSGALSPTGGYYGTETTPQNSPVVDNISGRTITSPSEIPTAAINQNEGFWPSVTSGLEWGAGMAAAELGIKSLAKKAVVGATAVGAVGSVAGTGAAAGEAAGSGALLGAARGVLLGKGLPTPIRATGAAAGFFELGMSGIDAYKYSSEISGGYAKFGGSPSAGEAARISLAAGIAAIGKNIINLFGGNGDKWAREQLLLSSTPEVKSPMPITTAQQPTSVMGNLTVSQPIMNAPSQVSKDSVGSNVYVDSGNQTQMQPIAIGGIKFTPTASIIQSIPLGSGQFVVGTSSQSYAVATPAKITAGQLGVVKTAAPIMITDKKTGAVVSVMPSGQVFQGGAAYQATKADTAYVGTGSSPSQVTSAGVALAKSTVANYSSLSSLAQAKVNAAYSTKAAATTSKPSNVVVSSSSKKTTTSKSTSKSSKKK